MSLICLHCGRAEAAHLARDRGTCERFVAPTRESLVHRLRLMAVDALSHDGRPIRSRRDAQVLIAAADFLDAPGRPPRAAADRARDDDAGDRDA